MDLKNDFQIDYIKEAFDKLYNRVMPYVDLTQFSDANTAFKELDKKVHSEIYILKKCLAESDRAVEAGLVRSRVLQNEINDLKKKIHELEKENIHKRPWHGDVNAMTGARTLSEMLAETIEFQNKKIEELEAEKARLKEAYDIHEATIERLKLLLTQQNEIDALKKENSKLRTLREDLSNGHEFEFGDKVFVPWSDAPYMYIKPGELYNSRTKSLVYVGKTEHLKWFGERFEIK